MYRRETTALRASFECWSVEALSRAAGPPTIVDDGGDVGAAEPHHGHAERAGGVARARVRAAARDESGFSLIELLVVMAIVGVILGGLTTAFVSSSKAEAGLNQRLGRSRKRG